MPRKPSQYSDTLTLDNVDPLVLLANLEHAIDLQMPDNAIQRVDLKDLDLAVIYYGGFVQMLKLDLELKIDPINLTTAALAEIDTLRLAATILGRDDANKEIWQPPSDIVTDLP